MPSTQHYKSDQEINEAYQQALRGGVVGASKWGLFAVLCGGISHSVSPIYKGLTIQFKIFLQLSAMMLGGVIEADGRMRRHELDVRMRSRVIKAEREDQSRQEMYRQLKVLERENSEWERRNS